MYWNCGTSTLTTGCSTIPLSWYFHFSLFMWLKIQNLGKFQEYQLGEQLREHLLTSIHQIIIPDVHTKMLSNSQKPHILFPTTNETSLFPPPPTATTKRGLLYIRKIGKSLGGKENRVHFWYWSDPLSWNSKITLVWSYLLLAKSNHLKNDCQGHILRLYIFISLHICISMSKSEKIHHLY